MLSAGALDPTFGVGGIVISPLPGDPQQGNGTGIAIQDDGKLVAAGYRRNVQGESQDIDQVIARYNLDGSLDSDFGVGGFVVADITSDVGRNGATLDVAIDMEGRILAAGGNSNPVLARYLTDGTLDTSFAGTGISEISTSIMAGGIRAIAVQADGKIIAAGRHFHSGQSVTPGEFCVLQYNSDGSLDTNFGASGRALVDFGGEEGASGLTIDSSGRIILVGLTRNLSTDDIQLALARVNPDGTLDTTFDVDGKVTVDFPGRVLNAADVEVDQYGRIVVGATTLFSSDGSLFTLIRFNDDGSLDNAFDGDGIAQLLGSGFASMRAIELQTDGKIIAVGSDYNTFLSRWNTNGSLDDTFGLNGTVHTEIIAGPHAANDVALQADGRIVVVGTGFNFPPLGGAPTFGLARYLGDVQPASIHGFVFDDLDNDGLYEPGTGESGLEGITVALNGGDDQGPVNRSTVTASDGSYSFADVFAGTYSITADQAAGLLDGKESAGTLGGTVDNTQDSNTISGIVIGNDGAAASDYNFADIRPSDLLGLVWQDFNNDGDVNFGEKAIENVAITLTGIDDRGGAVNLATQTDMDGVYMFIDLRPGEYTVTETQPASYNDGLDIVGTVNGTPDGDNSTNDAISGITLALPGSLAENYNFGERPQQGDAVTAGQTATIGFWQNANGQALIESLNGSGASTQLSSWLAATFDNIYGADAGANDLTGMTNIEVASFYSDLFRRTKKESVQLGLGGPVKMDAQVMAVALATYVTNQSLAGYTAQNYGFLVTANGVGTATFNVGNGGEAFGVADNSLLAVLDLLFATNDNSLDGVLYDIDGDGDANDSWETTLRTLANDVYAAINEAGDI